MSARFRSRTFLQVARVLNGLLFFSIALAAPAPAHAHAGAGAERIGTRTRISVSPAHPSVGEEVQVTATVHGHTHTHTSTGWLSVYEGSKLMGVAQPDDAGVATLKITGMRAGHHHLHAVYDGDVSGAASVSPIANVVVVSSATAGEQARSAFSFTDSVGVVTHLNYDDTPYYNTWDTVLSKLKQAGIRHLRDGYGTWPASSPFLAEHRQLAAAGIHTTYMVGWETSATVPALQTFASLAGDMEALEGPNECDAGSNCGGGGATGIRNAALEMTTLAQAGKALNLPVLGPSFTIASSYAAVGDLGSEVDFSNLHVYYGNNAPGTDGWGGGDAQQHRYGSLAYWMDQGQTYAAAAPSIITESGYISTQAASAGTLPESVEAAYVPRTLLGAYSAGIQRTFLYELLDEVSSPGYGLLRADLSEKPAFTAVRNLMSLLEDTETSFFPGKLNYTLAGNTPTLRHVLLQKQDGSFYLILWAEESSFNTTTNTIVPVVPQHILLTVADGPLLQQATHFNEAGEAITTQAAGTVAALTVDNQITMIKISADTEVQ